MMTDAVSIKPLFQLFKSIVCYALSRRVEKTAFRLDAGSYAIDAEHDLSVQLMNRPTKKLGELAHVFGFGPFKRTYIASPDYGIPLLTSSEMMEIAPDPAVMAKANSPKWEQYQIKRGWILVSCSGTIGNVALVPQYWDDWAASQDAIRVVPQPNYRGLIWAFLSLSTVRHLMVSKKSGSVIDHIYAENVASLDLLVIPEQVMSQLNQLFDRVLNLREESRRIHDESIVALLKANSLPVLEAISGENIEITEIVFLNSRALALDGGYRLDAQYYNLTAQLAISNIKQCRNEIRTVGDLTNRIFFCNRFSRTFVDAKHGIPYLAGKNIIQIRPIDISYLSTTQTDNLDQYRLRRGWILMTCSGTIGRTCLVWKNFESYVGTHDLIRIVPDESKIDGGYLYAFLSSKYGEQQVLRYRHGSVIDHVTPDQVQRVLIPFPSRMDQIAVGDLVREAYEKRADAIRLENEAQEILMKELANAPAQKGG